MECKNSKEALTYAILSTSSVVSLIQCQELKYARVAFGLYVANGCLGLLSHLLPRHKHELVKTLLETSTRVTRHLYMPLITAEASIYSGLVPQDNEVIVGMIFVVPCFYLFWTEVFKKDLNKDFLRASALANTITLLLSSRGNSFGVATSLLNCVACVDDKLGSKEYFMLIALANFTAFIFFKHSSM